MTRILTAHQNSLEEAKAIIRGLVEHEDRPCSFDHHGYCQEHGWLDEGECIIHRGRRFLGLS